MCHPRAYFGGVSFEIASCAAAARPALSLALGRSRCDTQPNLPGDQQVDWPMRCTLHPCGASRRRQPPCAAHDAHNHWPLRLCVPDPRAPPRRRGGGIPKTSSAGSLATCAPPRGPAGPPPPAARTSASCRLCSSRAATPSSSQKAPSCTRDTSTRTRTIYRRACVTWWLAGATARTLQCSSSSAAARRRCLSLCGRRGALLVQQHGLERSVHASRSAAYHWYYQCARQRQLTSGAAQWPSQQREH